MTTEMMEWLNQNRYRSYPMVRDAWREIVPPKSGLDMVLLDALVFDSGYSAGKSLVMDRIYMSRSYATVNFSYGGEQFEVSLSGGDEGGFHREVGRVQFDDHCAMVSMVFSSHSHLKEFIRDGSWSIGCPVLPSRIVGLSDGHGIDALAVNGSEKVLGHEGSLDIDGEVVLEDGYRTSPIISNGRVLVRVGRQYGLDPCAYDYGKEGSRDCRKPLFFFCGQNAVNNGNIVLSGGVGISVSQGKSYTVREDEDTPCKGKSIPAIEITAGQQIMDMYKPSKDTGDATSDSQM